MFPVAEVAGSSEESVCQWATVEGLASCVEVGSGCCSSKEGGCKIKL